MDDDSSPERILALTAEIVSSHVANNRVELAKIPAMIEEIYAALANLGAPVANRDRTQPAVPIKKSVTPEHIICLEDGKKLKMLKRHLRTAYNMSPQEYRERWGLPQDYPMVAPNYAKQRSNLAKKIGLGTRSRRSRDR